MIDLIRYLLGEILSFRVSGHVFDFYQEDPSVSATFEMERGGEFFLQCVDCRNFTIFEMDLIFEDKRIRITDLGFKIEVYEVGESEKFKNYKNIFLKSTVSTSFDKAFLYMAEEIYLSLEKNKPFICSLEDGLEALKITQKITEEVLKCQS